MATTLTISETDAYQAFTLNKTLAHPPLPNMSEALAKQFAENSVSITPSTASSRVTAVWNCLVALAAEDEDMLGEASQTVQAAATTAGQLLGALGGVSGTIVSGWAGSTGALAQSGANGLATLFGFASDLAKIWSDEENSVAITVRRLKVTVKNPPSTEFKVWGRLLTNTRWVNTGDEDDDNAGFIQGEQLSVNGTPSSHKRALTAPDAGERTDIYLSGTGRSKCIAHGEWTLPANTTEFFVQIDIESNVKAESGIMANLTDQVQLDLRIVESTPKRKGKGPRRDAQDVSNDAPSSLEAWAHGSDGSGSSSEAI